MVWAGDGLGPCVASPCVNGGVVGISSRYARGAFELGCTRKAPESALDATNICRVLYSADTRLAVPRTPYFVGISSLGC